MQTSLLDLKQNLWQDHTLWHSLKLFQTMTRGPRSPRTPGTLPWSPTIFRRANPKMPSDLSSEVCFLICKNPQKQEYVIHLIFKFAKTGTKEKSRPKQTQRIATYDFWTCCSSPMGLSKKFLKSDHRILSPTQNI